MAQLSAGGEDFAALAAGERARPRRKDPTRSIFGSSLAAHQAKNRLWTMAGLFWAMAVMDRIDGWTNGENEDAACVEPWRATCCMLLDPYKRGGNLKLGESKEKDCLNGERAPALPSSGNSMYGSQISSWYFRKTKFWRSWVMTLRFLVYGNAVY